MSKWPVFGNAERQNLLNALDSGNWWRGPYAWDEGFVGRFERAWAEYCGVKHCLCVPNGTLALELALTSVGVKPGDEVIVPAITFVATATAVMRVGAVPVIVDVDPETYQISTEAVFNGPAYGPIKDRERITAAMPVHYGGCTAPVGQFALAELPVVVDAAEAAGNAGPWGDVATFSFQAGKQLTCGEGGALITDDDNIAEAMWGQANAGATKGAPYPTHGQRRTCANLRMTEWQGAILCAQFERFEEQRARQLANAKRLNAAVDEIDGLDTMPWPTDGQRGFYLWHVKFRPDKWPFDRDAFLAKMAQAGAPCGTGHTLPLHMNQHLATNKLIGEWRAEPCPEAERIYREEAVAFSHKQLLTQRETEKIVEAMRAVRAENP